ncbi:TPA: hypothetical protein G8O67_005537 [Salmonella enterica]|uniref:Uncharacterized protein n=1 Tax=Salmonella enterica TaxID=28901 RepID=A0A756I5S3_SALER|nr:hypothetical protein [Salmonella enterica]
MKHQKLTKAEAHRLGEAIAAEARAMGFIGVWGVMEPKRRLSGSIEWSITGKSIC